MSILIIFAIILNLMTILYHWYHPIYTSNDTESCMCVVVDANDANATTPVT